MLMYFRIQAKGICLHTLKTKLDGKEVCDICYATALNHLQRYFNQLNEKVIAIHPNNTNSLREIEHFSAADTYFATFTKEAGYAKLHHHMRRKDNDIVL